MKRYMLFFLLLCVTLVCVCSCADGSNHPSTNLGAAVLPQDSPAVSNPPKPVQNTVERPTSERPADTVEEDPVIGEIVEPEPVIIPSLEEGAESSSLIYDFYNGCLDWHVSIHRDLFDSGWYFLRYDAAPQEYYVDWYVVQDGFSLPPAGSEIEKHVLSDTESELFDSIMSTLPEERVIQDAGWTLYIVDDEAYYALDDSSIEYWSASNYTTGRERPFLADGSGWPTEWLRREPYISLLGASGLDMSDPWWDDYSYMGTYRLVRSDADYSLGEYQVQCVGVNQFSWFVDGEYLESGLTFTDVCQRCDTLASDIPGVYQHAAVYIVEP